MRQNLSNEERWMQSKGPYAFGHHRRSLLAAFRQLLEALRHKVCRSLLACSFPYECLQTQKLRIDCLNSSVEIISKIVHHSADFQTQNCLFFFPREGYAHDIRILLFETSLWILQSFVRYSQGSAMLFYRLYEWFEKKIIQEWSNHSKSHYLYFVLSMIDGLENNPRRTTNVLFITQLASN